MTYDKILVPVDFSDGSRSALKHAAHLGKRVDAKGIDVLHVWEPPRYLDPKTLLKQEGKEETLADFVQSQAGQAMKEFLTEVEGGGNYKVMGRLETGDADETILDVATTEAYDLIVIGAQGEAGVGKLGSITQRVLRNAACPVLTVRTAPAD